MILLSICHLWSDIAFATPSLWAAVCFSFPVEEDEEFTKEFETWLFPLTFTSRKLGKRDRCRDKETCAPGADFGAVGPVLCGPGTGKDAIYLVGETGASFGLSRHESLRMHRGTARRPLLRE
ncbi:hypothetical protein B0H13DRAFT_2140582 [Mycena leptocephala]|nr:hypothetical protein B0H13DRAFT_2140582 [Mycena leptocephala]